MAQLPPELRHSGVYVTSQLLGFDEPITEADVIERLGGLSVYDCLGMVGRLSAALYVNPRSMTPSCQLPLVEWLARDVAPDLRDRLRNAVTKRGAVAVFDQQLIHLARLAVQHADPSPPVGFSGTRSTDFLICLFGVPDLLHEPEVDLRDSRQRLSWALRHCGINQSYERLTLWSVYFEVFRRIWPVLRASGTPDADEAFERYTGVDIEAFMTAGFAFSASFANTTDGVGSRSALDPADYFSSTELDEAVWKAFLQTSASSLDDLRSRIADEEQRWGETPFGSLAIEKTPLLLGPDGRCYLLNMGALDRRVTHGILHLLAEESTSEGLEREHFTAPFGAAFQKWAEGCLERGMKHVPDPPDVIVDESYGTKQQQKRTSDIVLRYPHTLVMVEVVAGPLQARTVTRGDLEAFDRDFAKLVEKKAEQLDKRANEIFNGETTGIGLDPAGIREVWPVIVTATPFPQRPEIGLEVRRRIKDAGLLKGRVFRPIAIISAEDLAAAEGALEEGTSFLDLLRGWKSHRRTGDHSFKNYLIDRETNKRRKPASHHATMFDEACEAMIAHVFPGGLSDSD